MRNGWRDVRDTILLFATCVLLTFVVFFIVSKAIDFVGDAGQDNAYRKQERPIVLRLAREDLALCGRTSVTFPNSPDPSIEKAIRLYEKENAEFRTMCIRGAHALLRQVETDG